MFRFYDKWPTIAKESFELNSTFPDFKNVDHIVFAGMGASPVSSIDFVKDRLNI